MRRKATATLIQTWTTLAIREGLTCRFPPRLSGSKLNETIMVNTKMLRMQDDALTFAAVVGFAGGTFLAVTFF